MKNGIPCNDYLHVSRVRQDRIVFRFVTEDGNTPSACTVRAGTADPVTGEEVSERVLREYYRLADHQVYVQNRETKGVLYPDGLWDDEGNEADKSGFFSAAAPDPFGEDEPDDVRSLREFAESLSGRLADVYEALLVMHAGGKEKISMTDVARKWGVSVTQICKDREKIIRMIREKVKS